LLFIHVRSKHPNALPVIITHGWPGSIIEQMKVIGPLTKHGLGTPKKWRTARRPCTGSVGLAAWMLDHGARSYALSPRSLTARLRA
jgi:hypothetical protein